MPSCFFHKKNNLPMISLCWITSKGVHYWCQAGTHPNCLCPTGNPFPSPNVSTLWWTQGMPKYWGNWKESKWTERRDYFLRQCTNTIITAALILRQKKGIPPREQYTRQWRDHYGNPHNLQMGVIPIYHKTFHKHDLASRLDSRRAHSSPNTIHPWPTAITDIPQGMPLLYTKRQLNNPAFQGRIQLSRGTKEHPLVSTWYWTNDFQEKIVNNQYYLKQENKRTPPSVNLVLDKWFSEGNCNNQH